MSIKRSNKGRKSLTAVGAVVAAGLSPGIASSTPAPQPPSAEVELTAADAVAINGDVFDFDELFAMRQVNNGHVIVKPVYGPPHPKVYGPRPPVDKDGKKPQEGQQKDQREQARQDSIRQAMEKQSQALVYGPPPPRYKFIGPEELRDLAAENQERAAEVVLEALMDYPDAANNIILSEDPDLVRELKMGHTQLEMLQQEIERRFGVQVTEDMLKQLGSLRRVANFVATVAAPIKKED